MPDDALVGPADHVRFRGAAHVDAGCHTCAIPGETTDSPRQGGKLSSGGDLPDGRLPVEDSALRQVAPVGRSRDEDPFSPRPCLELASKVPEWVLMRVL